MKRVIFCIDQKSFYASIECVRRGVDPFTTPLVVVDTSRGPSTIVLAVSPYLKTKGVPSRCQLRDLPTNIPIIYAVPKMQDYIDVSCKIVGIFLNYISKEDLHVYSIDESFLDVTNYLKFYNKTPEQLARTIQKEILDTTGVTATCGIGDNLFLAKAALDNDAKKKPPYVAYWRQEDIREKLWPLPVEDMWGIGDRMSNNLHALNIYTIKDLANFDLATLVKLFGLIGEEIYNHANGIDLSVIREEKHLESTMKSFSAGQVMYKDYNHETIKTIMKEMIGEVCARMRSVNVVGQVAHLYLGYNDDKKSLAHQIKLSEVSDDEHLIYNHLLHLLEKYHTNEPIRRIAVSIGGLEPKIYHSLSLFNNEDQKIKDEKINVCLDKINTKFHRGTVYRAVSKLEEGTLLQRRNLIGGHNEK